MGRYSPVPVTMSSPHPQEECIRRLAKVTSVRGSGLWYLDPKTAVLPDPLLRGYVWKSSIQIEDFTPPSPMYGGHPFRLEAELTPTPNGGTTLKGQVRPTDSAEASGCTETVVMPFGLLVFFITGLVQLSRGHIAPAMLLLLATVAVGALLGYRIKSGGKPRNEARARLLQKVAGLLDATIESPEVVPSP